jgi:hypothetical protein
VAVVAEQHEEGAEEEEGRKWWRTWKLWAALLLLLLIGMGAAAGIVFGEQRLVGAGPHGSCRSRDQEPCWISSPHSTLGMLHAQYVVTLTKPDLATLGGDHAPTISQDLPICSFAGVLCGHASMSRPVLVPA